MNAAFLLVTGAMLVGQGGDKKPAAPPAAPAVAASCGHNCGCDGFGHRLRDKLRGLFCRDNCDSCPKTTACAHEKHARTPLFHARCEQACKPKLWKWEPACREPKHCASTKCQDSCNHTSLLDRLRGAFHRDRCCDSACSTATPAKAGEKIEGPKKMPDGPKGGDKKKPAEEVRIVPEPATIAPNAIPAVPSVEIVPAPVPAPRVGGDRRDPF